MSTETTTYTYDEDEALPPSTRRITPEMPETDAVQTRAEVEAAVAAGQRKEDGLTLTSPPHLHAMQIERSTDLVFSCDNPAYDPEMDYSELDLDDEAYEPERLEFYLPKKIPLGIALGFSWEQVTHSDDYAANNLLYKVLGEQGHRLLIDSDAGPDEIQFIVEKIVERARGPRESAPRPKKKKALATGTTARVSGN